MSRSLVLCLAALFLSLAPSSASAQSLWLMFQGRVDSLPAESQEAIRSLRETGGLADLIEAWEISKQQVLEYHLYASELSKQDSEQENQRYVLSRRKVQEALAKDPASKPGERLRYLGYQEPIVAQGHTRAPNVRAHFLSRDRGPEKRIQFILVDLESGETRADTER